MKMIKNELIWSIHLVSIAFSFFFPISEMFLLWFFRCFSLKLFTLAVEFTCTLNLRYPVQMNIKLNVIVLKRVNYNLSFHCVTFFSFIHFTTHLLLFNFQMNFQPAICWMKDFMIEKPFDVPKAVNPFQGIYKMSMHSITFNIDINSVTKTSTKKSSSYSIHLTLDTLRNTYNCSTSFFHLKNLN